MRIFAELGSNATLPCQLPSKDTMFFGATGIRVKWTKVAEDEAFNEDVLLSMGFHKKTFGSFEDRVSIVNSDNDDGSILITNIAMQDAGKYQCELINGMTDVVQEVHLEVQGGLKDGGYFASMNRRFCLPLWDRNRVGCLINTRPEADRVGPICPVCPVCPGSCFPFQPGIVSHLLAGIAAACFSSGSPSVTARPRARSDLRQK